MSYPKNGGSDGAPTYPENSVSDGAPTTLKTAVPTGHLTLITAASTGFRLTLKTAAPTGFRLTLKTSASTGYLTLKTAAPTYPKNGGSDGAHCSRTEQRKLRSQLNKKANFDLSSAPYYFPLVHFSNDNVHKARIKCNKCAALNY